MGTAGWMGASVLGVGMLCSCGSSEEEEHIHLHSCGSTSCFHQYSLFARVRASAISLKSWRGFWGSSSGDFSIAPPSKHEICTGCKSVMVLLLMTACTCVGVETCRYSSVLIYEPPTELSIQMVLLQNQQSISFFFSSCCHALSALLGFFFCVSHPLCLFIFFHQTFPFPSRLSPSHNSLECVFPVYDILSPVVNQAVGLTPH